MGLVSELPRGRPFWGRNLGLEAGVPGMCLSGYLVCCDLGKFAYGFRDEEITAEDP